jgi:hypothetical protein
MKNNQCIVEERVVARNRWKIDFAAAVVPRVFHAAGKWLTAAR